MVNIVIPTKAMIARIMPHAGMRVALYYPPLIAAMEEFEILDVTSRSAMFLAQIAHESAEFRYVREIASGAAYDTGKLAERLGNTPEADGDGKLYKGRGLIQITGRNNYRACGKALDADLIKNPELLEQPDLACRSAGWFWSSRNLNELADANTMEAFKAVTKKINGGYNGLDDRIKYWNRARDAFR